MLECVINVSEGRDTEVLAALDAAAVATQLDRHTDHDHHRSVFTLAHHDPATLMTSVQALARAVASRVDLNAHAGVHPRLGALDVVPFVALAPSDPTAAVDLARTFAPWWSNTFAVPTFFYDAADPMRRTLPALRRDAFETRSPDHGPAAPHPRLGATAVGARAPMVAVNVELDSSDRALAASIARTVRERDGGLAGVRALGFALASVNRVQVSMNVVDLDATSTATACTRVRVLAANAGVQPVRVELVGLVPAFDYERWDDEFRAWSGWDETCTVEWRAARLGSG